MIYIDARPSRQDRDSRIVRNITIPDTRVHNLRNFESRFRIDVLFLPAYPIFMKSIEAAPIIDEQTCWQAVLERDRRSDGKFVYAVRSTGIFCRPSCPSRKPRREQVSFYPDPATAQQQGYRPCKRCRPQEESGEDPDSKLVGSACEYLAADNPDSIGLEQVAAQVGATPARLRRAFKNVTGLGFKQFTDARRLDQFKIRLRQGQDVTGALYDAGYGSISRLYEKAPSQMGMTPATYRKGGQGVQVAYTISECSLGRVLVAATDRGICAIHLGDDANSLESGLAMEYPNAQLERVDGPLQEWVDGVLARIDGHPTGQALPLDVRATAFQRRVWQHLTTIPRGETRTYGQVTQDLGEPKSARAVARACAANPVALVVPCHRVVRQDGGLGGYRWGLERKAALLERESFNSEPLQDEDPAAGTPASSASFPLSS